MAKKTLWKVFGADIIVNLKYLYPVKVMDDLFPHNSYMRNSAKRSGKKEVKVGRQQEVANVNDLLS